MNNIIEVRNLSFKYQKSEEVYQLNEASSHVKQGVWLSIIGHNGSGKSTVVRLIDGLLEPEAGEIYISGDLLTSDNVWDKRSEIGMVFQNPDNQFVGATVEDDVAFGLENQGIPRDQMVQRVHDALKMVHMEEFKDREPARLSGGQKQRLSIARAVIKEPDIYIFDDSFSALDYRTDAILRRRLKEVTQNATVLIVAQRVGTIMDADQIIVLDKGEIVGRGRHEELMETNDIYREIAESQLKNASLTEE